MLNQHPIPQNVTNFEFRLIGDMTIKQFGYLAGGAILAMVAYSLPIPVFFKWPLIGLFALLGIGFAFIPIEERPMDVWFISFIKSVYSPTLYIWQREQPKTKKPQTNPAQLIAIPSVIPKNFLSGINVFKSNYQQNQGNMKQAPATQNHNAINASASAPRGINNNKTQTQPQSPQKIEGQANQQKTMSITEEEKIKKSLFGNQYQASAQKTPQASRPSHPNVISGIVKQKSGDPIHSILVTVKDESGIPVRALKTDKTGRFFSATPLPNGIYTIETEDPKKIFFFETLRVSLAGQSINPIEIFAKSKQDIERQRLEEALFGRSQKP